ncbi:putative DNA/RNA-binding protein Alba [Lupinus albus]|uniref:Putative DNA/RNA-binding protein Alba n=1 Tax=Lupinus albus TaxID=3870 RepID=A0A6A4NGP4_LUPAL|nr:putative DNA/RNA-binding protein Alba [Lupinus albus]
MLCLSLSLDLHVHLLIFTIATVVTVAEILKNNGLAVEKSMILSSFFSRMTFSVPSLSDSQNDYSNLINNDILFAEITTSTVDIKDDSRGRPVQKAKIEIILGKTANFDELMAAAAAEDAENGENEEQNA